MRESLQIKPEEKLIFLSADIRPDQVVLNQLNALIPQIENWEVCSQQLIDCAAAPLFFQKMETLTNSCLIPDNVKGRLRQATLRTLSRNMLLTEHFRQVVRAFTAVGIPVIALKGAMLSEWLYGDINLRQFSDLDLLVPENRGLEAVSILEEMGYTYDTLIMSEFIAEHTSIVHYKPMNKNGVSVEVHIRIHSEMEKYQVDLTDMWEHAVPLKLHGVDALGFAPEDLLLHLCIHLDKHFIKGSFQFTSLYDLVNLLNHKGNLIDWSSFESKCRKANALSVTYKYLLLVQKYMNAKLPVSVVIKFARHLHPKDERAFLAVLRGKRDYLFTDGMMKSLEYLDSGSKRLRYVFDLFFPSVSFMMRRYRLKSKIQLIVYYPYRHLRALMDVWKTIRKTWS